jgi:hypothetical protein
MLPNTLAISALILVAGQALAQAPETKGNTTSVCERFAGAAREHCLLDEKRRAERQEQSRAPARTCDHLLGAEKEACLHKGGTVKAGMPKSPAGRS